MNLKNADLISIIVPVYNVEKYVRKSVESILNQTIKNIEIILVDDGSSDMSGRICDEMALKDSRIIVIHKENGGLSAARNVGIENSSGKYIGFIDSDDTIEPDMYEVLYKNLLRENADLSICGVCDCFEKWKSVDKKNFYAVENTSGAIKIILDRNTCAVSACNKLYKKEIFDDINFCEGKTYEDALIFIDVLKKCKKIVFDSTQKYNYYHRKNSIRTSRFSNSDLDLIYAWEKNYKIINNDYPENYIFAKSRLCWSYFETFDKLIVSDNRKQFIDEENNVYNFLYHNRKFILTDKGLSKGRKISFFVLLFNKDLYKHIVIFKNLKLKKLGL